MTNKKNTYSIFKKYLLNKLSDKERHVFEKNVAKDSFEQEALEGMELLSPEKFLNDTEHLQNKITRKTHKKSLLITLRKYNTAASLFILVGTASYFYWTNRPDLPEDPIFNTPVFEDIQIETDDTLLKESFEVHENSNENTINDNELEKSVIIMQEEEHNNLIQKNEHIKEKTHIQQLKNSQKTIAIPNKSQQQKTLPLIEKRFIDHIVEESIEPIVIEKNKSLIKGTVVDKKGNPLPGVSIQIDGENTGIVSDFDGNFNLKGKNNDSIVFDYLGFESAIKPANDSMLVVMQEDKESLEEVVVIGYGTVKKSKSYGVLTTNPSSTPPQGSLKEFSDWIVDSFDEKMLADDEFIWIFLEFKIQENGEISNIKFKNKIDRKVRKEIKRVLKTAEKWHPAMENNIPVDEKILIKFELY